MDGSSSTTRTLARLGIREGKIKYHVGADSETETIRWPTNLDRKAIEKRLTRVAEKAAEFELAELAQKFTGVAAMPAAQIASSVVAALTWLLNQPAPERARYAEITRELEMVALNLKNLK
jgi:hypothetical protein